MCPRFFTQMDESVFSLDVIGRSCQVQSSVAIIILTKRKMILLSENVTVVVFRRDQSNFSLN